jgi:hypothetical protein
MTPDKLTAAQRKALAMLADSSEGATGPALESIGVAQATLDVLVARGLVRAHKRTYANPRGLVVMHYWIAL